MCQRSTVKCLSAVETELQSRLSNIHIDNWKESEKAFPHRKIIVRLASLFKPIGRCRHFHIQLRAGNFPSTRTAWQTLGRYRSSRLATDTGTRAIISHLDSIKADRIKNGERVGEDIWPCSSIGELHSKLVLYPIDGFFSPLFNSRRGYCVSIVGV